MTEIRGGDWVVIVGTEGIEGVGDPNDPCVVAGFMQGCDAVELYRPSDGAKLWVLKWALRRIDRPNPPLKPRPGGRRHDPEV